MISLRALFYTAVLLLFGMVMGVLGRHWHDDLKTPVHYVHFVKYDDAVSFYDAVSDTKIAIHCPQGSGTLCQQLLMMH